ncbi:flagellar hook-associated protein FlgK [Sporanaerobium hydrogeniformans]|uniref:Flagellar hook-associated protein FlgK n=1 Tax=Sporanaerobium hydrogeniformans TaxID=3072179 RepID=A0AC61DAN5_9FIRM|nr:flagellar hook-associated protein FlgK [Sporanaerobium hydrogeniformans]PHV69835.1 flagellar hook-associated protein FlgK [Sporanaerobium hydrogeniformans]
MASIASLGRMVSGLKAAQKGLQVTGQNLSNMNTPGYTRQQLLQHESAYLNIGSASSGLMQVGLGVSQTEIRQIRDSLADRRFRTESTVLNYYTTCHSAMSEIESILDEPYGEGVSEMLSSFWAQTQKLNTNPDGVEERLSFIQAANVLIKKANQVTNALNTYQDNLNTQVIAATKRINEIIKEVKDYNDKIAVNEINGDHANDYRDARNKLLDELATYGEVKYEEDADSKITLSFENTVVVDKDFTTLLELKQTKEKSPFVKPVWSTNKEDVYKLDKVISAAKETDTGSLKALLIARGEEYVNEKTTWDDIALNSHYSVDMTGNSYIIPKIQKKFNDFIHAVVDVANETLNGMGIGIHQGMTGVPIFTPIKTPADNPPPTKPNLDDYVDEAAYNVAYDQYIKDYTTYLTSDALKSYMVPGNLQVNPELLEEGGYNKLGTVANDPENVGDNSKITELLANWGAAKDWPGELSTLSPSSPHYKKVSIMNYYAEFVTDIGMEGSGYQNKASEKLATVNNIDQQRSAMSGVSQDEELTFMLKYQYAYNAAARMVTIMDGMMDTIINKM